LTSIELDSMENNNSEYHTTYPQPHETDIARVTRSSGVRTVPKTGFWSSCDSGGHRERQRFVVRKANEFPSR
jgi:hypothetical protein